MDFLQEIKNALQVTGQTAIELTKKIQEEKEILKEKIKTKRLIQEKLMELGILVYEMSKTKENKNEEVRALCREIKEIEYGIKEDKVQEVKEQTEEKEEIEEFKTEKKENDIEIITAEEIRESSGYLLLKFCPHCQVGNAPSAQKCISCGLDFS